jgi:hypothetical protein
MSAAQFAGRILEAWTRADDARFASELEQAAAVCRGFQAPSPLEEERCELLESVVDSMRRMRGSDGGWQYERMSTGMDLLRHLRRAG